MTHLTIRPVSVTTDAAAITEIYNHYILNTVITFEEAALTTDQLAERINSLVGASLPYLVAEVSGQIVGYAYAGRFHSRSAYRFTAESTVYLDKQAGGKGIGSKLYQPLLDALKAKGFHSAISIIALPNDASVGLHEKYNFRKAAHFSEVGYKFGQWHDVGYWQASLRP